MAQQAMAQAQAVQAQAQAVQAQAQTAQAQAQAVQAQGAQATMSQAVMTQGAPAQQTLAVIGAGSYGTALALAVASKGAAFKVCLWARSQEQAVLMQRERQNAKYLPGIVLPPNLAITSDLAATVAFSRNLLLVVPSSAFTQTLQAIKPYLTSEHRIAFATKGLEHSSGAFLSEVVARELAPLELPVAALSGPTFASELARGLPTAIACAGTDPDFVADFCHLMHTPTFRVYQSSDLIALQLGGAVKNVIAIGAGMSDGLGYGANARTALISRGLAEMIRLGVALGASERGFMGLSGLGDLMLTCTDNQSRNRRLGVMLGQGMSAAEALMQIGQVVEGYHMVQVVRTLALRHQIEMPICNELYEVLVNHKNGAQAARDLLSRELTAE